MGPLISLTMSGCELKTLLCTTARHESTQVSYGKANALTLGVSVTGNNYNQKLGQ
tara:strand:- start:124 stop:288 length:165 start_codon:yes stop_codon:yes gene_type:complete